VRIAKAAYHIYIYV